MHYTYRPENVCASQITFDMDDGIVTNIEFVGGCNGNLKVIPMLIDGWEAADVIDKFKNVTCGKRPTSCVDQLATALVLAIERAQVQIPS